MKSLILLLTISYTNAWLDLSDYPDLYPFDRELHRNVLDPDMCRRQLDYLRNNDTFLLFNFLDAGARPPKGILKGNFRDTGNYFQCLGIEKHVDGMDINGKYCSINVIQAFEEDDDEDENMKSSASDWSTMVKRLMENEYEKVKGAPEIKSSNIQQFLKFTPYVMNDARSTPDSAWSSLSIQFAICIPKVCTTDEVINNVVNISTLGLEHWDNLCRLPNDRHWVTADYIAIVVFSALGLIILISTIYDLYHLYYLERSPRDVHILRTFSAVTNMPLLMDVSTKPGSLQCLDGIRAIAMLWVIIGHIFSAGVANVSNLVDVQEWARSLESIWILGAPITVDTFFMISGLLVVYINMAKYTSMGLLKNLHVFYLNRLLRLFPVLALVILFEASLYNRISDGAFWSVAARSVHTCRAFWWSTLLHLQNFINPLSECISVAWYLAIDVNLHIISPLVLVWLLRDSRISSWSSLTLGFLVSITIATTYMFVADVSKNYFTYYYVNILVRSPPFFVGMCVGYFLRIYRGRGIKMHVVLSTCITIICMGLIWLMMYINYLKDYGTDKAHWITETNGKLIDSLSRSVWAAALGWIVFVCVNGNGGPINKLLSMNVWKIPARLSYSMYIVHFSVVNAYFSSMLDNYYFSAGRMVFVFFSCLVLTVAIAICLTGLIEIPCSMLVKVLLDKVTINVEKPVMKEHKIEAVVNGNENNGFVRETKAN